MTLSKDESENKSMNRPYVICHMTTSIDGKVTGKFLTHPDFPKASDIYYERNRTYKADAYACGRVTMQESFCGEGYPELSSYPAICHKTDYLGEERSGFYAVAFDPHGRLGWTANHIVDMDEDPGYDKAQIIEVLTEQVDGRYLGYLESLEIPYIFAGKIEIDAALALQKLKQLFGIDTLLLEGGSVLDGAFAEEDLIDELSLVIAPIVGDTEDKPLFMKSKVIKYHLENVKQYEGGVLWLNYKK